MILAAVLFFVQIASAQSILDFFKSTFDGFDAWVGFGQLTRTTNSPVWTTSTGFELFNGEVSLGDDKSVKLLEAFKDSLMCDSMKSFIRGNESHQVFRPTLDLLNDSLRFHRNVERTAGHVEFGIGLDYTNSFRPVDASYDVRMPGAGLLWISVRRCTR